MSICTEELSVMKYHGYTGTIEACSDDKILHGRVLYIDDLICYCADDIDTLRAQFEASINDYIYDLITTFR